MEKLMKFESSNVQMLEIEGVWYFELYSVGMALGQIKKNSKGVVYPAKDRIDKNCENAEIEPCVRNAHKYITEEQIYDLMLETRTDKCRAFRKWLTNDVLPTLRKTGEYKMPESDPKPYEYFDKTFNGEPVLTSKDVEYLTKINRHTVDWYMRTKLEKGKDFYFAEGDVLRKYKEENPKVSRHVGSCYLVTREGFIKLCSAYGVKIETPKCFENKNPDEYLPMKIITQDTKDTMAEIREEAERLIHLTYLLDDARGTVLCGETYHQSKAAIIRQMKSIGNCVSLVLKFDF